MIHSLNIVVRFRAAPFFFFFPTHWIYIYSPMKIGKPCKLTWDYTLTGDLYYYLSGNSFLFYLRASKGFRHRAVRVEHVITNKN
jgi:hypothetical protein